jgi:GT2 family glycosyltransferase
LKTNLFIEPQGRQIHTLRQLAFRGQNVIILSENSKLLEELFDDCISKSYFGRILFYDISSDTKLKEFLDVILAFKEEILVHIGNSAPFYEEFERALSAGSFSNLVISGTDHESSQIPEYSQIQNENHDLAILSIQINTYEKTSEFIDSVLATTYSSKKLYLLDNYSNDYSGLKLMMKYPSIYVINSLSRVSYCEAFNALAEIADLNKAKYLFIVNNDTKNFTSNIFEELVSSIKGNIGIVSPKVVDYEKKPIHWKPRDFWGIEFNIATEAYLISNEKWKAVSGFRDSFVMYCEDLDLMMRLKKIGILGSVVPEVSIDHLGGATVGRRIFIPTFFFLRNLLWVLISFHGLRKYVFRVFATEAFLMLKRYQSRNTGKNIISTYKYCFYILLAGLLGLATRPTGNRKTKAVDALKISKNRIAFRLK